MQFLAISVKLKISDIKDNIVCVTSKNFIKKTICELNK